MKWDAHQVYIIPTTQKNKLSLGANPASDKFLSATDKFIYLQQININS
jgi:hypothetical protein